MRIEDLAMKCREQMARVGNEALIFLVLPGKWGKTDRKRLCRGGPWGHINGEDMTGNGVVVSFRAIEVLAFLAARGLVRVEVATDSGDAPPEGGQV